MSLRLVPPIRNPLDGLEPRLYPANLIAPRTGLQCGKCGFNGVVEFYIDNPDEHSHAEPFEPVCNCPIQATLTA